MGNGSTVPRLVCVSVHRCLDSRSDNQQTEEKDGRHKGLGPQSLEDTVCSRAGSSMTGS